MELFRVEDLTFSYPGQRGDALCGLSLTVERGEFLVLCGPSGCGKSTLLRQLKPALAPRGRRTGRIFFEGISLEELDQRAQSSRIGFVRQSPEDQIVTDKVWHELAFGLESLGLDTPAIRRRVAEMASFFGIQTWFYQDVAELSGGQKQLLNLASVMAMQPDVIILDEPTSQLDPIAAGDFLAVLGRINRELGATVLLTEHRLEEALPLAARAAVMDRGRILTAGTPRQVGEALRSAGHGMFLAMPTAMQVWAAVPNSAPCPVTVREGRDWLADFAAARPLYPLPPEPRPPRSDGVVMEAEELWFQYGKELPHVVRGLSLTAKKGELLALLGGNGAGKTTSLKLLAGLLRPCRGEVRATGRIGVLPQSPQALFVKKSVGEDLREIFRESALPRPEQEARIARMAALCRLEALLDRHPYDLSGGEQQRCALAKVLLLEPDILLMDEPTKGLDAEFKRAFAEILQTLLHRGAAIVMVSHDVEFCARYAHRCALFFDGGIAAEAPPRAFFSGNSFYTTSASRMARGIAPEAVTPEELMQVCGAPPPPAPEPSPEVPPPPEPDPAAGDGLPGPLPRRRRLGAAFSGGAAIVMFLLLMGTSDLSALVNGTGTARMGGSQLALCGGLLASLLALAACAGRRTRSPAPPARERRRLSRRTLAAAVLIVLCIPLTLFAGAAGLGGRKYYFIALLILMECMLPFFLAFEGRKPQARELAVVAVLCALGVAGRAALFMLPECKPVVALTVVAGVALGGETGFLVGAMTMLASNVIFSQGPWTPWQMFAMGIIGFLAGVLFRVGLLRRSRLALAVFGAICSVAVYGGIMNPASALMASADLNAGVILSYYIAGLPIDLIRGGFTFLLLLFTAEPMLEKLDRVKVKYGLTD